MRDFLKYTFASFVGLILFVTLGLGGLLFIISAIATASRSAGPTVEKDSILVLDLSTEITDSSPVSDANTVIQGVLSDGTPETVSLRNVLNALEKAATDDRIVGLYLTGNVNATGLGSGFATLREVREALQTFHESGKPIFAYSEAWAEQDYYLGSVADTVALSPSGLMELNGFRAETTFFAGALEKYGVGIQVLRVGRYKSAVEPFIRTSRSPEEREQTQQLLADLWSEFLAATSESQGITSQQLQAIANNQGLLLADEAQEAGLVDRVSYFDEIVTELRKLTGESEGEGEGEGETFRHIALPTYADVLAADEDAGGDNQVALVVAEGDIVSGEGSAGQVGGDRLSRQLRELRKDDEVKAIVLRINSPGGSATASEQIAREVFLAQEAKPVIVSMGSFAASGGYMIATYGGQIFASPNTITGSIGVFGLLPNVQELANQNGITWDVVKTGQYADYETIARPKTEAELAIGQQIVDRLYDRFLDKIEESRPIPRQQLAEIAQGRVWSGVAAERLGLVDELGGLDAAIQAAVEEADLGDDWRLEEYPKYPSFGEQFFGQLFSSRINDQITRAATPSDPLSLELQKLRADLETLKALNDPLGAYMRLPFLPRVN
ncbi:signal peptide peptidase SppA [Oculatella sp. FACHB-28]|uniref:signal peptide peptidase SppA n=1 Tax=Cyanophyceae TaxID=3028117 RepID=UPI001682AFAA|nr:MULTISPECIES: signal peptide peptidase SppA [Cyanophyceae]MBD1866934.1 signal peptide peptidase SppA [Cyanobacteria bacterium FACHB-471]MBD1996168.1 signal peptide peptidase SppA [Leptolyngbya sp. FACHB-541]MBD2058966.1 signal peptide peptidase SppA [Oculatella sp. FACHB-28]MBD2070957.1 signal peptide peptidase SppA [Leptolyngbya sp. FACHB-671]